MLAGLIAAACGHSSWVQVDILDPLMTPYLAASCDKARAGWPCDESMEAVRGAYARAKSLAEKRQVDERALVLNTTVVTHIPLGECYGVSAVRSNVETLPAPPSAMVFWGPTNR